MDIVFALLPIIAIFILLFILKQSSVTAGILSYVIAVIIALIMPAFTLHMTGLVDATIEGLLLTSLVAYVLLFGIWLFHLMNEAGLIQTIATHISLSTQDQSRQALILVIAFSPLVESVSGFGIAIIVIAPILIALGFDRFKAAMLSLVSLTAVPWGALSTGTVIGANLSGISASEIGAGTAIISLPIFIYFTIVTVFIVGGWSEVKKKWFEMLAVSVTLFAAIWFFSAYVSVELAGVFAALAALAIEMLFVRYAEKKETETAATLDNDLENSSLFKALSPYIFLTSILFLSRLIPFFENWLTTHAVVELKQYAFHLPLLHSPGFFLLMTCLFAIVMFKIRLPVIQKSFKATMNQWIPVNLSMLGFVAMAEVMSGSGMTTILAEAGAETLGTAFVIASPLIGALGGFLTGSNTGSNAMFIKLQVQTANYLNISPDWFATSQNASSGHMTMASPSRVLLGASISGIKSEESTLLKKMFGIASFAIILIVIQVLFIHLLGIQ